MNILQHCELHEKAIEIAKKRLITDKTTAQEHLEIKLAIEHHRAELERMLNLLWGAL